MDLVLDLLATVSRWSRSHLSEIALALIGCVLVLFGADFKGWVEQRLGSIAGALRVPGPGLIDRSAAIANLTERSQNG